VNLFAENKVVDESLNSDYDFKDIVDISPYPIFIHCAGAVKYANRLAKKMIGASVDEDLAGVNIAQYTHPADLLKLKEAIDKVHATRTSDVLDFRMVDRDGNVKALQSKSMGINFGGQLCRLVHIYNFDQIKQAEDDAHQKQVVLDKLVEELVNYRAFQEKINSTSPVLVTVFDIDKMTSIYRSQNMAQWFRYAEDTFPERSIDLVHPDYRTEAVESVKRVMTLADGEIQSTVYPFITGDGSIKFILSRSTIFQRDEATDRVTHTLSVHSDITDLKETESKLDKSEETRKAILYAIPDMVVIVSAEGIINDFYPNELHRSEFEAIHIAGKNMKEILTADNYG
jgi:PAS domain S-box-containing protein